MKAIVCTKYGSPGVLQLQEVAKPAPQDDEVLIRVYAASVNARDWRFMRAKPFSIRLVPGGFLQPKNKILGADLAGRVEAIGSSVKQFGPGDEVFGYLPSATDRGTFAEYVCAKENAITLKPANLTFERAAAVPVAAMTALQGLRDKGDIQPGQKVRNLEMVRSLGADHVIDYRKGDFTKNGQQYDLILAVNGYHPTKRPHSGPCEAFDLPVLLFCMVNDMWNTRELDLEHIRRYRSLEHSCPLQRLAHWNVNVMEPRATAQMTRR